MQMGVILNWDITSEQLDRVPHVSGGKDLGNNA